MSKKRHARQGFRRNPVGFGVTAAVGAAAIAAAVAIPSLAQPSGSNDPSSAPSTTLQEGPGNQQPGDNNGGQPGDGQQPGGGLAEGTGAINPDLSLDVVQVEILNLDDNDAEYAKFTFSRSITKIDNGTGFELSGYSTSALVKSQDAKIVQGEPQSVLAAYASGTDLASYTIGHVASGTVSDESGRTNLPSTTNLAGSTSSVAGTDAPRLTAVSANDTIDQITYTFDRVVKNDGISAGDLGFYTSSGREVGGAQVVTTDKKTVTVKFNGQVEDAVAYFAKPGAVTDSRGLKSVPNAVGKDTAAPHLTGVSGLIGSTQYEFTFSEPVADVKAENFLVYTGEGTAVKGSGVVQPSAAVVRIAFPEIQLFGDNVTLAAVGSGAVTSNDGSKTANTIASAVVGQATGVTAGPNLESVSVEASTGQVRYTFDKAIDDRQTYKAENFALITDSGDVVKATSFVEISGDSVVLNFNRAAAQSAAALTLDAGAVKDFRGDPNPSATSGL